MHLFILHHLTLERDMRANASIIKDGQIYSYEEAKLTSVKLDSTIKYPERSLFFGCKQLKITPDKLISGFSQELVEKLMITN